MKADGSEAKNITNDGFNNIYPDWAGKNKIIYGRGRRGEPTRIFTVRTDGTKKEATSDHRIFLRPFFARRKKDRLY
jgi:hypothetical protein